MPGIVNKILTFARSPQGQQAIKKATTTAQQAAKDPRTQERIRQVREQLSRRGGRGTR